MLEVSLEPGEVAVRDLNAEATPRREIVASRHGAHRELVDLPCSPASLFLASSNSGVPGSASFHRSRNLW